MSSSSSTLYTAIGAAVTAGVVALYYQTRGAESDPDASDSADRNSKDSKSDSNSKTVDKANSQQTKSDSNSDSKNHHKVLPPDHMKIEQFVRNSQFFGEKVQMERIMGGNSNTDGPQNTVIVVGCGGVGSHAAVTLARSGISRLRLIDFDQVTLSSLNRHAAANLGDVGTQKVSCLKKYIETFNPWCKIEAIQSLFSGELAEELLLVKSESDIKDRVNPAFVIDCIDNLKTKCDLIEFCHKRKIPIVISGGSACKCDPTMLRMSCLSDTVECELSRAVRQELRDREKKREADSTQDNSTDANNDINDDDDDICDSTMVVFSIERTSRGLMPLKEHQESDDVDKNDFAPLENFRVRTLPVIAPLPSIFGNALASYVLCHIAKQPFIDVKSKSRSLKGNACNREPLKRKAWRRFMETAKIMFGGNNESILLDCERSEVLVYDFYRAKGVVSGKQIGQLQLVPIDPEILRKVELSNLENSVNQGQNQSENKDGESPDDDGPWQQVPTRGFKREKKKGNKGKGKQQSETTKLKDLDQTPSTAEDDEVIDFGDLFDQSINDDTTGNSTIDTSNNNSTELSDSKNQTSTVNPTSFTSLPQNWLLVCQNEATQISKWYNKKQSGSTKDVWTGPLPDFLIKNEKMREQILNRIKDAEVFFEERGKEY